MVHHHLVLQGSCDEDYGSNFQFSSLSKELIVGDVFVRIYNQQPTFPLDVRNCFILK